MQVNSSWALALLLNTPVLQGWDVVIHDLQYEIAHWSGSALPLAGAQLVAHPADNVSRTEGADGSDTSAVTLGRHPTTSR